MSILSSLLQKPLALLEDKIAAAKAQAQDEVSAIIAQLLILLPILLFIFVALIILSAGVALFINHKLNHSYYGYLWVGGFYIILALVFILLSKSEATMRKLKKISDTMVFGKQE